MEELLKRWAELEPERCISAHDDEKLYWVQYAGQDCFVMADESDRGRRDKAIIQAAVQEAIEARGWEYRLNIRQHKPYHATIWPVNAERPAKIVGRADDTAAAALLTAYLEAISEDE